MADFTPETMQRFAPGKYDPEQDVWELYYLPDDFSQARDIADEHPEKLAELKELFWQEAERNRVLPLLGAFSVFLGDLPPLPTVTRYTYGSTVQNVQTTMIPRIIGRSYAIEGNLHVPEGGAEGVVVAFADFIGGFALWVDENGLLNHTYQFLGVDTYKQTSTTPIPTGDVTVRMLFEADEPKPGTGGKVTLWANDEQIGEGTMPNTISLIFTTHDMIQASRMADHTLFLFEGKLALSTYENIFSGRIETGDDGNKFCRLQNRLKLFLHTDRRGPVKIFIDPRGVKLVSDPGSDAGQNTFNGKLIQLTDEQNRVRILVDIGIPLSVLATKEHFKSICVNLGETMRVSCPAESIEII